MLLDAFNQRKNKLDGVIIETTGMADPAPVSSFLEDRGSPAAACVRTRKHDPAHSSLKVRNNLEQVAQTFFMDPSIEQACKLDAIITVVDGDTSAYAQNA